MMRAMRALISMSVLVTLLAAPALAQKPRSFCPPGTGCCRGDK